MQLIDSLILCRSISRWGLSGILRGFSPEPTPGVAIDFVYTRCARHRAYTKDVSNGDGQRRKLKQDSAGRLSIFECMSTLFPYRVVSYRIRKSSQQTITTIEVGCFAIIMSQNLAEIFDAT